MSSKFNDTKLIKCRKCHKLLCKTVPVHDEEGEYRIIHVKHKGIEIWAADVTIVCPGCRSLLRIDGEGIIGSEPNTYSEKS